VADEKLIEALLKTYLPNSLAAEFAKRMEQVEQIRLKIAELRKERDNSVKMIRARMAYIDRQIESVQATCSHPVWDYQSDPSGGRDRCSVCVVCGKSESNEVPGYDG